MINTVNCQRKNPFTSGNNDYVSFKQLLMAVPVIFLYSVIDIHRSAYDMEGYCIQPVASVHPVTYLKQSYESAHDPLALDAIYNDQVDDEIVMLMHSITQMNYLGEMDKLGHNYACIKYTDVEIFNYNFFVWCSSFFFIGLQFTHFDVGPMTRFTLDPAAMALWGPGMWTMFFVLFGMIGVILVDVCYHYYAIGYLMYYGAWAVALFGAIIWQTKRVAPERSIHVHHYTLGLIIMSFLCYQGTFFTLVHGFFNGMFIEGGSRWGFDRIWPYNPTEEVSDD